MSTKLDWTSLEGLEQKAPQQAASQQAEGKLDWSSLEGLPDYETRSMPEKEGLLKTSARYAVQPVIGALEMTTPGIIAGAWQALGAGEGLAEMQEWEYGNKEAELRKKFPQAPWKDEPVFNKEKYMEALSAASSTVPTVSNIASFLEKQTGLPLEARTKLQERLRLAGSAGKIRPGGIGKKATAAVIAPTVSEGLRQVGVPDTLADITSLGLSTGTPIPKFSKVKKASGMPTRWYEGLKKDTKLTPSQYENVKGAVEGDVKKLTTELIQKESETARSLAEDPSFPQKINDTFKDVERLAGNIDETIPMQEIKTNFIKKANKNLRDSKGLSKNEFEQAYVEEVGKLAKTMDGKIQASPAKSVEQYRKNNEAFSELYEPGKSGAKNRAKREALLDYNRTIADTFETHHPDSEFNKLFKYSNKKYSELMDLENIDGFMDKVFDKKINYKEANKFFKDKRTQRSFRNILGKEGYKDMEAIMKDFLPTEKAMSLLKKGEALGLTDMMKLGGKWVISPLWSKASALNKGVKILRNKMLAYPKFRTTWESALKDFKKGKFGEAQAGFKELDAIEKQTYNKVRNAYQKINKENPSIENSKILDQILEVNPEFKKIQFLKEPIQFERKGDILRESNPLYRDNIKLTKREWNKYLKPDMFSKYYESASWSKGKVPTDGRVYLGKLKDIIKDPKLVKNFEEIKDFRVAINRHWDGANLPWGGFAANEDVILLAPNLTPEKVNNILSHEGLHGLQSMRLTKGGSSRLAKRRAQTPPSGFENQKEIYKAYLENLNEVKARQFERWVRRDINKHRSTLEKTKMAQKLLEEQIRKEK